MKRIIFTFITILQFSILSSHLKAWDTTAAKYYPIKTGNSYIYKKVYQNLYCAHSLNAKYQRVEIKSDTLMPNGKRYYKFDGFDYFTCWNYQRIDSNSMNVYGYYNGSEILLDSLLAGNNTFFRGKRNYNAIMPQKVLVFDDFLLFNSPPYRNTKYVENDGVDLTFLYNLVENFGLCLLYACDIDSGFILTNVGCVINGVVYGDTVLTNVHQISSEIPESFSLSQNYPNPFNPKTKINYELGIKNYVSIKVFNALGKEVATLVNEKQTAGTHSIDFNGEGLPSGVYFYKLVVSSSNSLVVSSSNSLVVSSSNSLETGNFVETKRMVLLK